MSKRPAPPLDQLPYQRATVLRKKLHLGVEDHVRELIGRHCGTQNLRIVFGQLLGPVTGRDIMLPVTSEVVLEQAGCTFDPKVLPEMHQALSEQMECRLGAFRAGGQAAVRWDKVWVEENPASLPVPEAAETLTLYCPGGSWHFQVQSGKLPAEAETPVSLSSQRKVVSYYFQKGKEAGSLWWSVSLCKAGDPEVLTVELGVNTQLLGNQHRRMREGNAHSFSLIVRDLLRNARALVSFLRDCCEQTPCREGPCYYPGLFEPAASVQRFYADKALALTATKMVPGSQRCPAPEQELTQNIRRYNNLIKVFLIEQFVDTLPGPVRVLDLGCGQGQDLNKYSQAFRTVRIERYVGVDFAEAAVEEARRRYAEMERKGRREYAAAFFARDLRSPELFEELRGHGPFDVVSVQFALQYLADSEPTIRQLLTQVRGLLRPGGLVMGSIPSCDALLDFYIQAGESGGRLSNPLFSVSFDSKVWSSQDQDQIEDVFSKQWGMPYTFSLVGAVDGQEEYVVPFESFELVAQDLGFNVILDAPFREMMQVYASKSRYFCNTFCKGGVPSKLTEDEDKVFNLYSCFVLKLGSEVGGGTSNEPAKDPPLDAGTEAT